MIMDDTCPECGLSWNHADDDRGPCALCVEANQGKIAKLVTKYDFAFNGITGVATCWTCGLQFELPEVGCTALNVKELKRWAKQHRKERPGRKFDHCIGRKECGRLSIVGEAGQLSLTDEGALSLKED